jgi:hypothetical protein
MIVFRQTDSRDPFLWETPAQPEGRWHGEGEGPAHYFADTPDGAWAELLRHEEITDPDDLATIRRSLWAIDIGDAPATAVILDPAVLTGGPATWAACQRHAREWRARGVERLVAPSAALQADGAGGWQVKDGLRPAHRRSGRVIVDFRPAERFVGWRCVGHGHPPADLLPRVRHLRAAAPRRA